MQKVKAIITLEAEIEVEDHIDFVQLRKNLMGKLDAWETDVLHEKFAQLTHPVNVVSRINVTKEED